MKTGGKKTAPMYGQAAAGKNHHIPDGDTAPGIGAMTDTVINGMADIGINKEVLFV